MYLVLQNLNKNCLLSLRPILSPLALCLAAIANSTAPIRFRFPVCPDICSMLLVIILGSFQLPQFISFFSVLLFSQFFFGVLAKWFNDNEWKNLLCVKFLFAQGSLEKIGIDISLRFSYLLPSFKYIFVYTFCIWGVGTSGLERWVGQIAGPVNVITMWACPIFLCLVGP